VSVIRDSVSIIPAVSFLGREGLWKEAVILI